MNRRKLLEVLAPSGVKPLLLGFSVDELTDAGIERVWQSARHSTIRFGIVNGGTLIAAGYSANRYRCDVYDIPELSVIFPKVLALELGGCYPLERIVAERCDI